MRQSMRLKKEALEAHQAELNRDKAAAHARIDSNRELKEALEAGRTEDLAAIDSTAETQRTQINRRADMILASIDARIVADEAHLRDLDGGEDKQPKKGLKIVEGDKQQAANS